MRTADPDSPTRSKLLDAAEELMLARGYKATTVDDICARSRTTKSSFFHFFESKEDLAKAAVERFLERTLGRLAAAPFRKQADPAKRALGWLEAGAAAFRDPRLPKSCLLGNITQELAPTRPDFQRLCSRLFEKWAAGFVADLRAAGLPAKEARELGDLLMSTVQGSLILVKAKKDPELGARNMRRLAAYVGAALPRRKT